MMTPNADPPSGRLPVNLEYLLAENRLKRGTATPESIAALWEKAVESARDSELTGMSIDGALRAYDAGHAAALALLSAHGFRTGSGRGHHEVAFSVAAALGGEDDLKELVPDSTEVRGLRHGSMYDPRKATAEDRDHALEWMRRTLPAIRRAILKELPGLSIRLENYPPKHRDSKP
jgi:hypothetical protein